MPSDFAAEGAVLLVLGIVMAFHFWGASRNRNKARAWMRAHGDIFKEQFALVGFGATSTTSASDNVDKYLKEKSLFEFSTYATGRQNVAFVDINMTLKKRFNVLTNFAETAVGYFFDSFTAPADKVDAILYPFDGKEAGTVPKMPGAAEVREKDHKSTYDGFVFALVNKANMSSLRNDRYDVSITLTKDHPKLPSWAAVMSESAEITDVVLTKELISAVEGAGEDFEYLIITDQPTEKPTT